MPPKRNIYLVEAPSQYVLASTFLRFQEHYESPRFRGKIFSLEEFRRWYVSNVGEFSYYTDWNGFNIPSRVLMPFRESRFDPLSQKEKRLLKVTEKIKEPFYLIGAVVSTNLSTIKHEFVHGLFYTDPIYRRKVLRCLRDLDLRHFEEVLVGTSGYNPSFCNDEINAYATTGTSDLIDDGLDVAKVMPICRVLRKLFREHFGFSLSRTNRKCILRQIYQIKL